MNTQHKLVTHMVQQLWGEDLEAALRSTLTAPKDAKDGNLVAIQSAVMVPNGSTIVKTQSQFMFGVMSDGKIAWESYRALLRSGHPRLFEFAKLAMLVLADTPHETAADEPIDAQNPKTGEDHHAKLVLLRNAMLVTQSDPDFYIEDEMEGHFLEHGRSGEVVRAVVPFAETAHEKIELLRGLSGILPFVDEYISATNEDGSPVTFCVTPD